MNTMILFIGIQASGKTTFYNNNFKNDYVHINLDSLHTRNKENNEIQRCFSEKRNFVVDNTNPSAKIRRKYIDEAKKNNYHIVGYFFRSRVKECIERNSKRQKKAYVPEKAIACTSNKLEIPSYFEGFDELYFVYIENENMIVENWRNEDEI